MNKHILFIGCGKGGEILNYPNTDSYITTLEPDDNCRLEASRRLTARNNVTLLPNSIFKFNSDTFDEIFLIFPAPPMLFFHSDELYEKISCLLKKNGIFTLFSEIWPDNKNMMTCLGCEKLSLLMKENGFCVSEDILQITELPKYVRNADFLSKATDDIDLHFRKITISRIS